MANEQPSVGENIDSETLSQEKVRESIKSVVTQMGPNISKDEKKEHAKLLVKIFEQGISPKEAMKVTDREIAEIYSFAYHKFSSEQYEEAKELFKMLLTLEPGNAEFATALGVCYHRLKDYNNALTCYMLNTILAPEDPIALFYAYDCLINLKDEASAAMMLSNVIARAGDQKKYEKIKEDAKKIYERLEQKLINETGASS
jgi:type III secretion system low calcium response chaperone LcrH/SycD